MNPNKIFEESRPIMLQQVLLQNVAPGMCLFWKEDNQSASLIWADVKLFQHEPRLETLQRGRVKPGLYESLHKTSKPCSSPLSCNWRAVWPDIILGADYFNRDFYSAVQVSLLGLSPLFALLLSQFKSDGAVRNNIIYYL